MPNKTVTLNGIDDNDVSQTVQIVLSVADAKWTKIEPNGANAIFRTQNGVWMRVVNVTTLFANDATTRVGQLTPLVPEGAKQNDTGRGSSFETAVDFHWTVTNVTT